MKREGAGLCTAINCGEIPRKFCVRDSTECGKKSKEMPLREGRSVCHVSTFKVNKV